MRFLRFTLPSTLKPSSLRRQGPKFCQHPGNASNLVPRLHGGDVRRVRT
jgi:hypothetical protein